MCVCGSEVETILWPDGSRIMLLIIITEPKTSVVLLNTVNPHYNEHNLVVDNCEFLEMVRY